FFGIPSKFPTCPYRTINSKSPLIPSSRAVHRVVTQILSDTNELVVLGVPVAPGRCPRLDLAAIGRHGDVGDGRILGLAGAMAEHTVEPISLREVHRFKGLAQ